MAPRPVIPDAALDRFLDRLFAVTPKHRRSSRIQPGAAVILFPRLADPSLSGIPVMLRLLSSAFLLLVCSMPASAEQVPQATSDRIELAQAQPAPARRARATGRTGRHGSRRRCASRAGRTDRQRCGCDRARQRGPQQHHDAAQAERRHLSQRHGADRRQLVARHHLHRCHHVQPQGQRPDHRRHLRL